MKNIKKSLTAITLSIAMLQSLPISNCSAASIDVKVYFSNLEPYVYGVPNSFDTRLLSVESKVHTFYYAAAAIDVNFLPFSAVNNGILTYDIDTCKGLIFSNLDTICTHGSFSFNNDTHHTRDINVISDWRNTVSLDDSYVNVFVTASKLCTISNNTHKSIKGMYSLTYGDIIVEDWDYVNDGYLTNKTLYSDKAFTATLTHEIGHRFGVSDHSTATGNSTYDNCIWGANKNNATVYENLMICPNCLAQLHTYAMTH